MADPEKTASWWHTLPGILTGIAATITAVGGLLLTLSQLGFFKPTPPDRGEDGPPPHLDISGRWTDNYGTAYNIRQAGGNYAFDATNAQFATSGTITVNGAGYTSQYEGHIFSPLTEIKGTCAGTIDESYRRMEGNCSDPVMGQFRGIMTKY